METKFRTINFKVIANFIDSWDRTLDFRILFKQFLVFPFEHIPQLSEHMTPHHVTSIKHIIIHY